MIDFEPSLCSRFTRVAHRGRSTLLAGQACASHRRGGFPGSCQLERQTRLSGGRLEGR